ncbi:MAG TPA: type II toxin-antitoxin system RelE/ParE family toxin [Chloroflexota bacterium]|nr:type II toxin-antitoxin system RelE/ParE family toxin [Chloroflexota bacterium]HUM69904.1 type II toxin-antitoxin system RelE/ParE family toxin [Chloroflexota bacterium]
MFEIRLLDTAVQDLAKLDQAVARRIIGRLRWLGENIHQVRREPLAGNLAGLFKFRVGDYRVIYQMLEAEQVIVVHQIGHRREVYR